MKKTLLLTGAALFILSTTSCLVKSRVCNCTYTDSNGYVQTQQEEYIGGLVGTSKKQQITACDNFEASLISNYGAANCTLN